MPAEGTREICTQPRSARLGQLVLMGLVAVGAIGGGCTTVETHTVATLAPPERGTSTPIGTSGSHTSVSVKRYGTIPYDGFTLPLVSPDGKHVATQTGVAPTWPTLVGLPSGSQPKASGIDVYSLEDLPASNALRKSFSLIRGYVLGRSANQEGFLIEAPQPDGSRRIGLVRWPRPAVGVAADAADSPPGERAEPFGEVEWIVTDERLNAFPALGPDGALAWCARGLGQEGFSLVVRRGDATFEVPPEEGQSWMLPTFAADGSLFAFRVRDGIAEVAHASSQDPDAFEQSLTLERVSVRADAQRVWQSLAPVDALSAVEPRGVARSAPTLFFRSHELGRMMAWSPSASAARPLADGSFALCLGEDGTLLWSNDEGVVAVPPTLEGVSSEVLARNLDGPRVYDAPAVPRRIAGQPAGAPPSFLLLVPERQSMGRAISLVRITLVSPPRIVGAR